MPSTCTNFVCAKVDFSIVSVPEESGIDFVKITQDGDYVCMPQVKGVLQVRVGIPATYSTSQRMGKI